MAKNFLPKMTTEHLEDGLELEQVEVFNKKVSQQFKTLADSNQARFTIDSYYQAQDMRINCANKIRSMIQGLDNKSPVKSENEEKFDVLFYQYLMFENNEKNLKNILDAYSDSQYLSRWARQVTGIGPVLAASLPAYLQIIKEPDGSTKMHAGSWWDYAGLNDNNRKWIGHDASKKLVEQCIAETGGKLTDETMNLISARSKWPLDHFYKFKDCYNKKTNKWSKECVIRACSVIPYNKKLKVVMHKIGTSFHKLCNNDKSLYGKLFKERVAYETLKNERGDYAEQAKEILETKNFANKEMKKVYESGRLPISHIYARCERYVTKLFLSHAFEAEYYNQYGVMPPRPYILCFSEGQHNDYIGPEVPYDSVPRDCIINN